MLSAVLETEIRAFCDRVQAESPLFINAASGKLNLAHVRRYIESLHRLVTFTPVNLRLAIDESEARCQSALTEHFRKKFAEEQDHHLWAETDLKQIEEKARSTADANYSTYIDELVRDTQAMIKDDPRLYVVYILLIEYATVIAGPQLMSLLRANCQVDDEMMSIVGNHVELDKEHVREGLLEIDRLLPIEMAPVCVASLQKTMGFLEDFFADVGTVH